MATANIYQIFYSDQTRKDLDPGFIPLDNSAGRSDWYEYWAIRNFIMNNKMNDGEYYGFLSPKFNKKTHLDAAKVRAFMDGISESTDVVLFSPYFDAGALFENIFVQGVFAQPDTATVISEAVRLLHPGPASKKLVMDSSNTVFCNYFLAKPSFWRQWFCNAELVFRAAEEGNTEFGRALNKDVGYLGAQAPAKTFVIERLASLLLATDPQWRVQSFNPLLLPLLSPNAAKVAHELVTLDALKTAAIHTGRSEYMTVYSALRERVLSALASRP